MAIPWNIRGSASQLFFQDETSPQYLALLAIADVPHPDRSILGAFIEDASDPPKAAQYFLHAIRTDDDSKVPGKTVLGFLADWKDLIRKFRPTSATSLSHKTKALIFERDGGRCCLTRTPFKSCLDDGLEYVHIISHRVLTDPELSKGTLLFELLSNFLSEELLEAVCERDYEDQERLDNIVLLSTQAFHAVKTGEVFLAAQSWMDYSDATRTQTYSVDTNLFDPEHRAHLSLLTDEVHIENRTPLLTPSVNKQLIDIDARFAKSSSWMQTKENMNAYKDTGKGMYSDNRRRLLPGFRGVETLLPLTISPLSSILRRFWIGLPCFVRASVYDALLHIGRRIYGSSLSMTVFKLPFGLYLRKGTPNSAPKYHVEAHTLRVVEQSTCIPAPRAIDVLETSRSAYLLMTCVPGRPIGHILNSMSDEQVKQAVNDLKHYVSELRKIPQDKTEFRICNSQGGGILDWRLPDSQRGELRFKSESDFNHYLTEPFGEEIRKRAVKSHDIHHEIFPTHGDLNPRNILAENGKITGIVDWENAGWFPEYWEYTKAHYSVRSLRRWLADVVDQVFDGYRDELLVENMLSDALSPF